MPASHPQSALQHRIFLRIAAACAVSSLPFVSRAAAAPKPKPKLGLIGFDNAGSNLGRAWTNSGYEVMLSSTDLEADRKLAAHIKARLVALAREKRAKR